MHNGHLIYIALFSIIIINEHIVTMTFSKNLISDTIVYDHVLFLLASSFSLFVLI